VLVATRELGRSECPSPEERMRIERTQQIVGHPALGMPQLRRDVHAEPRELACVQRHLPLARGPTQRLLGRLCRQGYLAPHARREWPAPLAADAPGD